MDGKNVGLIVTVVLAFITLIAKYFNDMAFARRKDRLERINLQLRNLYGPLYAIDHATNIAWNAFRSRYRPNVPYFTEDFPPTEEDLAAWRLWMSEVFMPMNLRMEKAIVENGDLIIEKEMPESLLKLIAHVEAYKPVLKKWEGGDFSDHMSLSVCPDEIRPYVQTSYMNLQNERARLLGKMKRNHA